MAAIDERSTQMLQSPGDGKLILHSQLRQLPEQSSDPMAVIKWLEVNGIYEQSSLSTSNHRRNNNSKDVKSSSQQRPVDNSVISSLPNKSVSHVKDKAVRSPEISSSPRQSAAIQRDLPTGANRSSKNNNHNELLLSTIPDQISVSSSEWGDDVCEFDRMESLRVRYMFDQIERTLFDKHVDTDNTLASSFRKEPQHNKKEGKSTGGLAPTMLKECHNWTTNFPHFRILGLPLAVSKETLMEGSQLIGHQEFSHELHESVSSKIGQRIADNDEEPFNSPQSTPRRDPISSNQPISPLLTGQRMSFTENLWVEGEMASMHQPKIQSIESDDDCLLHPCYEEILHLEGVVEEPIAVDEPNTSDVSQMNARQSQNDFVPIKYHSGCPPMSPNAALRDDILNSIFDTVWKEVYNISLHSLLIPTSSSGERDGIDTQIHHSTSSSYNRENTTTTSIALDRDTTLDYPSTRDVRTTPFVSGHDPDKVPVKYGDVGLRGVLQVSSKTISLRPLHVQPSMTSSGKLDDVFSNGIFSRHPSASNSAMYYTEYRENSSHEKVSSRSQIRQQSEHFQQKSNPSPSTKNHSSNKSSLQRMGHPITMLEGTVPINHTPISQRLIQSRLTPQLDRLKTPELLSNNTELHSHARSLLLNRPTNGNKQQRTGTSAPPEHLQRSGTLPPLISSFLTNRNSYSGGTFRTSSGFQRQTTIAGTTWNTTSSHISNSNARSNQPQEYLRPATTQVLRTEFPTNHRPQTPQHKISIVLQNDHQQDLGVHGKGLGSHASFNVKSLLNSNSTNPMDATDEGLSISTVLHSQPSRTPQRTKSIGHLSKINKNGASNLIHHDSPQQKSIANRYQPSPPTVASNRQPTRSVSEGVLCVTTASSPINLIQPGIANHHYPHLHPHHQRKVKAMNYIR